MSKIIYLAFENLPQRYTKMWNDSFISCMSSNDIVVWGNNQEERVIKNGEFLDICDTIAYKQTQIIKVADLFNKGIIEDGNTFFVPDIFYPGLASIRYMSELIGIKVKIVAFNHAGRADKDDFVQKLKAWSDIQEQAWHEMCDVILVGSKYHKERVAKAFRKDNIVVTGAIWSKTWIDNYCKGISRKKENYIIYPHRPCREKRFDLFLEIAKKNPSLNFVITSSGNNRLQGVQLPLNVTYKYNLTKKEYYEIFAHAKGYLSTAFQETFGYTLQEAIYFNCQVVVPDYACYREYANESSIVSFKHMCQEGYLTKLYNEKNLRKSKQFTDNAQFFYKICKQENNYFRQM